MEVKIFFVCLAIGDFTMRVREIALFAAWHAREFYVSAISVGST